MGLYNDRNPASRNVQFIDVYRTAKTGQDLVRKISIPRFRLIFLRRIVSLPIFNQLADHFQPFAHSRLKRENK